MSGLHKAGTEDNVGMSSALHAEVCTDLTLSLPSQGELYRYLGYRQGTVPSARIASRIEQVTADALSCLNPRGAFALYAITGRTKDSLTFGNATISGNVAGYLATAERIAVFVATIGEEVSQLAAQTRQNGDSLAEWILDAFGSWAAEATADALMERIRGNAFDGEALTLRYSPGYCGMALEQQRTLFQMVQAEAIGVTLMPSMLMYPLKSISGIVGLGPQEKVSTYRAPCDYCNRDGCHMRR
jgi:hypothetical protein